LQNSRSLNEYLVGGGYKEQGQASDFIKIAPTTYVLNPDKKERLSNKFMKKDKLE
jgi:hypothetical protein